MAGNLKNNGAFGFQSLMYINFITRKKYRVDSIAKKMGINRDTLYRYVRGELMIPADRIADLIRATEDIEYLEFFCDALDFTLVPKIKDKNTAKMFGQMVRVLEHAIDSKEGE